MTSRFSWSAHSYSSQVTKTRRQAWWLTPDLRNVRHHPLSKTHVCSKMVLFKKKVTPWYLLGTLVFQYFILGVFQFVEDVTLVDSLPPPTSSHTGRVTTWILCFPTLPLLAKGKRIYKQPIFFWGSMFDFRGVYTNCLDVSFQVLNQHCTPQDIPKHPRISRNFNTASLSLTVVSGHHCHNTNGSNDPSCPFQILGFIVKVPATKSEWDPGWRLEAKA